MALQSMTVTETQHKSFWRGPRIRVKLIISLLVVLIILAAICGYYLGVGSQKLEQRLEPPDPVAPLGPSASLLQTFQKAAVCTDAKECSKVGKDVLNKNGSAVDAAIAAMFCNGLLNQQSMGVGGGFFMTVYIKSKRKAYGVNGRETAPGKATRDMYKGDKSSAYTGPLAIGIPGEVRGLWAAHQEWGILPWKELIAPTLELCRDGYIMSKALHDGCLVAPYIINDSNLRKTYYDEKKKDFYPPGTHIKPYEQLCNTLERIADKGGDDFYNGTLADDIIEDLDRIHSIVTKEDLVNYKAIIKEAIAAPLNNGDILYTPGPPSSGLLLGYILNILKGYNFNADSISTTNKTILTYHRIVEAFKHAYSARNALGDEEFLDLKEIIDQLTSPEYGESIRLKINDTMTSNDTAYYGVDSYFKEDAGTAHISILSQSGDAVSVTSSVNYYYGAGFTTKNTGIIMNNVMDDFSNPGFLNYFGLKPSPVNFIKPGKRPLSSMTPVIIVDQNGNAKMTIGASGGTKITTAIALAIIRNLWFGQNIKTAVDGPRFHHQIFPMKIEYEYGIIQDILDGLKAKGHAMERYRGRGSVVCAIYRNQTGIYANADYRKGGIVEGVD